jgi:spore coat polysaccharide biosynthesis protein SpsF
MRLVAIIQARMGSSRLPGKVLMPLVGEPMLFRIVERLRNVSAVSEIVVATSDRPEDSHIVNLCKDRGISFFSGSESDVLDRFYQAAKAFRADWLVRITGDCPLIDPSILSKLIEFSKDKNLDYAAVATGAGALHLKGGRFPDGMDAECFSFKVLEKAAQEATLISDREHVTPYIWRNTDLFVSSLMTSSVDYSTLRLTVDNKQDFDLIQRIYQELYDRSPTFGLPEVVEYLKNNHELLEMNRQFMGHEGYEKLWKSQ